MSVINSFVNVIAGATVLLGGEPFMDKRVGDGSWTVRKLIGLPLLTVGGVGVVVGYLRNKRVRGQRNDAETFCADKNCGCGQDPCKTYGAETCVSCETPDSYYVGGLCSDSGEIKCISCCSCDDCHNRWSQLEVGEMQGAETFESQLSFDRWSKDEMDEELHGGRDMNFEDWLDDEIDSHGKGISLKRWGDEEEGESEHQHAEYNR